MLACSRWKTSIFLGQDITKALAALGLAVIGPVATNYEAMEACHDRVDAAVLPLDLAATVDFAGGCRWFSPPATARKSQT